MEQSCVGRRIEWSNPALATGLRTRRGGCSDAGQVARPGGGFYAGQVARQWSAMNDENFNRERLLCRAAGWRLQFRTRSAKPPPYDRMIRMIRMTRRGWRGSDAGQVQGGFDARLAPGI